MAESSTRACECFLILLLSIAPLVLRFRVCVCACLQCRSAYLNDVFTIPSNLAGIPALSVPGGLGRSGLPLGLQLLGDYHSETRLIDLAAWIQARVAQDKVSFEPFQGTDLLQQLVNQQAEKDAAPAPRA